LNRISLITFISKVGGNSKNHTEQDWGKADKKFEKLTGEKKRSKRSCLKRVIIFM